MVALHYAAVRLCLTGFDDLPFVAGVVQLETVLVETDRAVTRRRGSGREGRVAGKPAYGFPWVLHLPDAQVLQRDDPPGLLILRDKVLSQPPPHPPRVPRPGGQPCAYRRVFKVIEAVVGEDEPAPLPGLHAPP